MAYSNVSTPVFYIDNLLYHKTMGTIQTDYTDLVSMSPSTSQEYTVNNFNFYIPNLVDCDFTGNMKWYYAILNHNFTDNGNGAFTLYDSNTDDNTSTSITTTPLLNGDGTYSGSSIMTLPSDFGSSYGYINLTFNNYMIIGAVSTGVQYTMPHSPDLKLNMEIEMDGTDTITTSSGASISNIKYTGNPLWNNGDNFTNPFEVYSSTLDVRSTGARRNGRKSWSLKFSYIADTDLFSSNPKASSYTEHPNDSTYSDGDLNPSGGGSNATLAYNIDTDDSFYAQVWNKTLGGALPFIFQPDSNFYDDFYICKFDQDSLKISQSAFKVYDIAVKIIEVW